MTALDSTSFVRSESRGLAPLGLATSASALAVAALVLTRRGPAAADYHSAHGWGVEIAFTAYLLLSVAAVLAARRAGLVSTWAARLVAVGYPLIATGVVAGMVVRKDPGWFALVAIPGNLLAAIGFVVLAVSAVRRRTMPVPLALLAGVGGFLAIALSEFGTSALVGVFWLALVHWHARR